MCDCPDDFLPLESCFVYTAKHPPLWLICLCCIIFKNSTRFLLNGKNMKSCLLSSTSTLYCPTKACLLTADWGMWSWKFSKCFLDVLCTPYTILQWEIGETPRNVQHCSLDGDLGSCCGSMEFQNKHGFFQVNVNSFLHTPPLPMV